MFGAICGDVVGSTYEFYPTKRKAFELMPSGSGPTDDTVCTAAVASALLRGWDFDRELRAWVSASTQDGFGPDFIKWARQEEGVGHSAGNGAAMRVSAIPWLASGLAEALDLAAASATTSHDHPDAVTAALAVVAAGRLALEGWPPTAMGRAVQAAFGYDLATPLDAYRAGYAYDVTAKGTVGPSLRAVVEARSWEDAVRNAVSMGGDADTMAAIAGGVAEAYQPVPHAIGAFVRPRLPGPVLEVLSAFEGEVRRRGAVRRTGREAVPGVLAGARERHVRKAAARTGWRAWLPAVPWRG